ncbi:hypothetical protein NDR87_13955 [Nocardia sp. CDC159]|uniref:Uncharacterized protein n=1 Tax=Nocardia pulmonis TaxID=2951408 RepID=A0A9X2IWM0_9NOCA|nr:MULTISPECIES: hypothetical protein [Nocardia]MCM6774473.1 hypothetical protein [Nocardia pulmonis]MCM6787461.1 hypothetical protein [Nocardia sp. CDC159]
MVDLLVSVARERGYVCGCPAPGVVELVGPYSFRREVDAIRRELASHPREQWPRVMGDLFDTSVITAMMDAENPLNCGDFGAMRGLIRTRLDGAAGGELGTVRRIMAPGLVQRVLIDRVHTVESVTYDMLRDWPIGEYELFALSEYNVRADDGVDIVSECMDVPMGEGLPPLSLLSGPEYLTAHALWLGEYPVTGPSGDAVVILPSKEWVYAYPVIDLDVIREVNLLARIAANGYLERPWPISPHVYLWRQGRLKLAATVAQDDDTVRITPTEDFLAYLNTLSAPPGRR